jgi:hypothetical protein
MGKLRRKGCETSQGNLWVAKQIHVRIEKNVFINADAGMHMGGLEPVYVLPTSSITSTTSSSLPERQLLAQGRLTTAQ